MRSSNSLNHAAGVQEIKAINRRSHNLLVAVFAFSVAVNLLMLTGPLYMLQIYDRVLGARSEETLVALSVLVAFLFFVMGILDYARGQIMTRVGARFQSGLDGRVFAAHLQRAAKIPGCADARSPQSATRC